MEKTFKLTQRNDRKLNRVRLLGLLFTILSSIGASLIDNYNWKVNPFMILIIFFMLITIAAPVFYPRFKFIGELIIGSERIIVKFQSKESIIYPIDKVENIEVKFRGTKGDNFISGMTGRAGLAFKDGAGNILSFEHLDENFEFEFFSVDDMDYKAIKRIFIELEKKGIKVSMIRIDN